MESIWSQTTENQARPPLQRDLTTDVVVIGGGLAGILTAYFLKKKNVGVIVLEARQTGDGQTKNTTAKITSQHRLIYDSLLKKFGENKARQYAKANQDAIADYRRIITEQRIDCFFEERPSYLYTQNTLDASKIRREAEAAGRLGIKAEFILQTKLPFAVAGAVRFSDQAQFHPLAFLQAISKDLQIYEHTNVIKVQDHCVFTDRGTVTAKHIVFASHFPFMNRPGYYFMRMYQERSYVLGLKNAPQLDGMYLGIDANALSFRNFENMLLIGGGSHRTGCNPTGNIYPWLREKARTLFPQSTESCHWSAQDCLTLDGIPYIGRFSAAKPYWYVATGFGKWGMTHSMAAAAIISDCICGIHNPCSEVFSPLRCTPSASAKNLLVNLGQTMKGLTKQILPFPAKDMRTLPQGRGAIVYHHGKKFGAYKDENNTVYLISIRCPHLGCQLEWNPDEKSWDCPCHGSRFDYKGNILDNPAQKDLEKCKNERIR